MISRIKPFRQLVPARSSLLRYTVLPENPEAPVSIPVPETVTLLSDQTPQDGIGGREALFRLKQTPKSGFHCKKGDPVTKGEVLTIRKGGQPVVSPIAGTVTALSPYIGDYGRVYMAVTISASEDENTGDTASALPPVPAACLPGRLQLPETGILRILINGVGTDLCTPAGQYVLRKESGFFRAGFSWLSKTFPETELHLVVPEGQKQDWTDLTPCQVHEMAPVYPQASPRLLHRKITGSPVPTDLSPEEAGTVVVSAEAIAAMGQQSATGVGTLTKRILVVEKDGSAKLVAAMIGTPVSDIFSHLGLSPAQGDRIIIGGPMTGYAVYSDAFPVCPDTEAILIRPKGQLVPPVPPACINCGQCIRSCPANVPVNLLIRVLEAGQYDAAADEFDLQSCIDCGLCSFVCPSRIPIFQHIQLAKYERRRQIILATGGRGEAS